MFVSCFICYYFLPFQKLCFHLAYSFLCCAEALILIKSHLFIFVFISIAQGGGSKRIMLWFMSKTILPMFFSKSFIVSGLIFRFLIHFEFIFVYGVRWCSNFTLLHVATKLPLDCKEIQPVHPKGDQSWVFIGRTDAKAETAILWPMMRRTGSFAEELTCKCRR